MRGKDESTTIMLSTRWRNTEIQPALEIPFREPSAAKQAEAFGIRNRLLGLQKVLTQF